MNHSSTWDLLAAREAFSRAGYGFLPILGMGSTVEAVARELARRLCDGGRQDETICDELDTYFAADMAQQAALAAVLGHELTPDEVDELDVCYHGHVVYFLDGMHADLEPDQHRETCPVYRARPSTVPALASQGEFIPW